MCSDASTKERLIRTCLAAEIQVRPLWYPNHMQRPYRDMQSYQITKALDYSEELVNIPCSVTLTEGQIAQVVAAIRDCDHL